MQRAGDFCVVEFPSTRRLPADRFFEFFERCQYKERPGFEPVEDSGHAGVNPFDFRLFAHPLSVGRIRDYTAILFLRT